MQVLSYVAQFEREQIKQRQMEGIREAKKKGKKFGRPKLVVPNNLPNVIDQYKKKEITLREGADILGVSKSTFHSWIKNS